MSLAIALPTHGYALRNVAALALLAAQVTGIFGCTLRHEVVPEPRPVANPESRQAGEQSDRPLPQWTRKALALIAHVEQYAKAIHSGAAAADRIECDGARSPGRNVLWGLRMLYRTTGRCEFADVPEDQMIDQAEIICERYRAFLAEHGREAAEDRTRAAIQENIALLRTDVWWFALEVIGRDVEVFVTLFSTGADPDCRWLIDDETKDYIHAEVSAWWAQAEKDYVWNEVSQRFVIPNLHAVRDDDEWEIAAMAGLLSDEWPAPQSAGLDWGRISAHTLRYPANCR